MPYQGCTYISYQHQEITRHNNNTNKNRHIGIQFITITPIITTDSTSPHLSTSPRYASCSAVAMQRDPWARSRRSLRAPGGNRRLSLEDRPSHPPDKEKETKSQVNDILVYTL